MSFSLTTKSLKLVKSFLRLLLILPSTCSLCQHKVCRRNAFSSFDIDTKCMLATFNFAFHSIPATNPCRVVNRGSIRGVWNCTRVESVNSAVQCSAVQCSAVQCSAVQCSAVQCSAVQCGAVHCSVIQCSAVQCSAVQCTSCYLLWSLLCRSAQWCREPDVACQYEQPSG